MASTVDLDGLEPIAIGLIVGVVLFVTQPFDGAVLGIPINIVGALAAVVVGLLVSAQEM